MADEPAALGVDPGTRSVALSERLGVLTWARLVLGVLVLGLGVGVPALTAGDRTGVLVVGTLVYLALHVMVLVALRRTTELENPLTQVALLTDAGWGTVLLFAAGQPASPLMVILELQVVAATVLFGWRSGLKLAGLDTVGITWVVLTSVSPATAGWSLGALPWPTMTTLTELPVVPGLAVAASLWLLTLATGYFTSVNQRDLWRSYRELAVLHQLTTRLERSLDLGDVSEAIAEGLVDELGYDRAVVWMPDEGGDLHPAASAGFRGDEREELDALRMRARTGPARVAVESRTPHFVGRSDPRPAALADAFAIDSALVLIPLISDERLLGLVSVEVTGPAGRAPRVGDRELGILATMAREASLALDNARLHAELRDLSVTDALTGVYNHRYFQQRLQEELDRSIRQAADGAAHPVSLILMDIDYFKRVNDRFGHPSGDELLHTFARLTGRVLRSTDIVCRYGGEEFGVILPDTGEAEALIVAERLREAIERSSFVGASGRHLGRVTCSFGVATHVSGVPSRNDLIGRADGALYRAKEAGRNRVVHADRSDEEALAPS